MQDTKGVPQRRSNDVLVNNTLDEILQRLNEIQQRQIEYSSAFTLDDLGKPDFYGHRQRHISFDKAHELMDKYKTDATKRFIDIVVTAVCTLLLVGASTYFKMH